MKPESPVELFKRVYAETLSEEEKMLVPLIERRQGMEIDLGGDRDDLKARVHTELDRRLREYRASKA